MNKTEIAKAKAEIARYQRLQKFPIGYQNMIDFYKSFLSGELEIISLKYNLKHFEHKHFRMVAKHKDIYYLTWQFGPGYFSCIGSDPTLSDVYNTLNKISWNSATICEENTIVYGMDF